MKWLCVFAAYALFLTPIYSATPTGDSLNVTFHPGPNPTLNIPSSGTTSTFVTRSSTATLSSEGSSLADIPAQSTSPAPQTTSTANSTVSQDVEIIHERRLSSIVGALSGASSISMWLDSLGPDGKWPDNEVDYTTGCEAQRANWPAQEHWQRIVVMAAAWHGGLQGGEEYVKDDNIRNAISQAMNYWFSRDFTNLACLDSGGTTMCPCSNPDNSLWNTNWFSNIILIPDLVGQSCLLLNDTLAPGQLAACTRISGRSYGTFDHNINGVGFLTGANTLDVAAIGIDLSLLTVNISLLTDAYRRIHTELAVRDTVKADGIRRDGSFGQHGGVLYNGNYGKDYANDILGVEIEAGGTQFAANTSSQAAFAALFDGNSWMIYLNSLTSVLHWDFSVLGRFISFPVIDNQATGSIKINLTQVKELGQQWSSSSLINFANTLSENATNANAGHLVGNRMFYTNDYMVHRGSNYVSTIKMFSSRTQNTECINTQNPLGFHLSDGALYTYLRGDEYEDISAAWDWNLIPGTTVDYGATPLSCDRTQFTGIEQFVGGVSDGSIGIAAMRYTNPFTKSLRWQKAWFFLEDDVQHVIIVNISSSTADPVYSILDQRRRSGPIFVDGLKNNATSNYSEIKSLWHGNIGYIFPVNNGSTLSLQVGEKSGNWSTIGISTQPPTTVDLFAAWIHHTSLASPISYTSFPGTDVKKFLDQSQRLRLHPVQNDAHLSAIYDEGHDTAMIVFWDTSGGSTTFIHSVTGISITISVNGNIALIYQLRSGEVTISDPSQSLSTVEVVIIIDKERKHLNFTLPQGGLAGSSITQRVGNLAIVM